MATKAEKSALWQTIRQQHPALAASLKAARACQATNVAIDGYPAATNRWLMDAIKARRPNLAKLLVEEMLPDREAVKDLFGRPAVCVEVDELVGALIEFERMNEGRDIRKAG